ncbi:MAG: SbcC/MukB-like Walker B domain-containing protein [Polyangiales bacterium]
MFLTSLALAVGLSDVVQAHAGGIRMEALFIDEGFGNLDDTSLDVAMRTLLELRGHGRLVGLISHVDALKDRIPTHLTVRPGPHGSVVRLRGVPESTWETPPHPSPNAG